MAMIDDKMIEDALRNQILNKIREGKIPEETVRAILDRIYAANRKGGIDEPDRT